MDRYQERSSIKGIANGPQCMQIRDYTGTISVLFSWNLKLHTISGISIVTKKILIHDILGLTEKYIIPGHCRFPLTNLHKGLIVGFTKSWGKFREVVY